MSKNIWKKISTMAIAAIVAISLLSTTGVVSGIGLFAAQAAEIVDSGVFGNDLRWSFDEDGLLRISGNGDMGSFSGGADVYQVKPWRKYEEEVKTVIIDEGITSIGDCAFINMTYLRSVSIPSTVRTIGREAFEYCIYLDNVVIPEGTETVEAEAFICCYSLDRLTLPESLKQIGSYAFGMCINLVDVYIPAGVTYIGESAFTDESSTTSRGPVYGKHEKLTISGHHNSTAEAFANENYFPFVIICDHENTAEIPAAEATCSEYGYTAGVYCYDCEQYLNGHQRIERKDHLDADGDGICDLCGKKAVKIIDSGTFGVNGLEWEIDEEGTLTIRGEGAIRDFSYSERRPWSEYTEQIKTLVIEEGITEIGEFAFHWCWNLEEVVLPDSATSIRYGAFNGCDALTSIIIPKSVSFVSGHAFEYCYNLETMVVDSENTALDSRSNCNAIIVTDTNTLAAGCKGTVIPESVLAIGSGAFYGCSMERMVIPEGVLWIEDSAFSDCSNLKELSIPSSVIGIGVYMNGDEGYIPGFGTTFIRCSDLERITVSPDNTFYDSRDNCNAIIETTTDTLIAGCKNTTIPSSVKTIHAYAFYGNSSLEKMVVSEGVERIYHYAFDECYGLQALYLPKSILEIEDGSFWGCYSLRDVYYGGSEEDLRNVYLEDNDYLTDAAWHFNASPDDLPSCLNHEWDDGVVTEPATCKKDGVRTFTCTICGATMEEPIWQLPHNVIGIPAMAATCEKDGLTAGSKCTVCGDIIEAQKIVKASGHKWDEGVVTTAPTCTKAGVKTYTCTVCEETKTEAVPATGHMNIVQVPAKAATLKAAGNIAHYKCNDCETLFTDAKGTKTTTAAKVAIAKLINISTAKVTVANQTYTGKKLTPDPVVKIGNTTLKKDTDYTVEKYSNNTNAGKATVTIKGKGKYGGSTTGTFTIKQATNGITKFSPTSKTLKYNKSKAQTIQLKATAKFGTKVTYAKASVTPAKGNSYITVSKAGKVTVKKVTPKGTYTVKVKVTAAGTKNYKAKTVTKKLKIVVK